MMRIGLKIIVLFTCTALMAQSLWSKATFLTPDERDFLERVKRSDYIAIQVRSELTQKPKDFNRLLLRREITAQHESLVKSLDNAWVVRDNFEMQELFFKILEREIAPRSSVNE